MDRKHRSTVLGAAMAGAAAALVWAGIASSAPATTCNGTINGNGGLGDVVVPAGATCTLNNDTVTGTVTVKSHARLYSDSTHVTGMVKAHGSSVVQLTVDDIDQGVVIEFETGAVGTTPADDPVVFEDNTVSNGSVTILHNKGGTGDFEIATNTASGDFTVSQNKMSGDGNVSDNHPAGRLVITNNKKTGPKSFDGNSAGTVMVCSGNKAPVESHGNVAPTFKGGQCLP
jgi:hypothetical protein